MSFFCALVRLLISSVTAQPSQVEVHVALIAQQCHHLAETALPFNITKLKQRSLLLDFGQRLNVTVFHTGYLLSNQGTISHPSQLDGGRRTFIALGQGKSTVDHFHERLGATALKPFLFLDFATKQGGDLIQCCPLL